MKTVTIILCVLLTAVAGCSTDTVTTPEDGAPSGEVTALDVVYETDDARAASAPVTPGSGGTVQVTSADGVVFDLDISPGAVDSNTTVTITPFSELSIVEEGASALDTACVHGAYFEPDGLVFDSTATLTVSFPKQGIDCNFDDITIVSVDSSASLYEILPATFDAGTNTLTCTLQHFSGWGTHGPDRDLLERLINSAVTYGNAAPSDEMVRLLASYRQWAQLNGWNDLANRAWDGAWAVFGKLAELAIAGHDIDEMVRRMQQAQGWGWTDHEAALAEAIDSEVRHIAARGRDLCRARYYAQGRALMFQALEYAQRGLVADPAFQTQIASWLADCGAVNVEISADKTAIYDLARSENDNRTFVTFEVRVTDMNGDPVEDARPNIWWELPSSKHPTALAPVSAVPDQEEPGVTRLRFGYRASPVCKIPPGTAKFWGVVNRGGVDNLSAPVLVELKRASIQLNCTFFYEEEWTHHTYGGGALSASYTANGVQTTQGNPNCAEISRSYDMSGTGPHENESGECRGLDDPKLPVCNMFGILYRFGQTNDEFQTPLTIVDRASVSIWYPLGNIWTECSVVYPSGQTHEWEGWEDQWERFHSTREIQDQFDYLHWDGAAFPPFVYLNRGDLPVLDGTWEASLSVSVTVE